MSFDNFTISLIICDCPAPSPRPSFKTFTLYFHFEIWGIYLDPILAQNNLSDPPQSLFSLKNKISWNRISYIQTMEIDNSQPSISESPWAFKEISPQSCVWHHICKSRRLKTDFRLLLKSKFWGNKKFINFLWFWR